MDVCVVIESHGNKSAVKGAFNSSEKARVQVRCIIVNALRHVSEAEVEDLPAGKRMHSHGVSYGRP